MGPVYTLNIKLSEDVKDCYKPRHGKTTPAHDSGYNLYVAETVLIPHNKTVIVRTGVCAQPSAIHGYYLMARSRIIKYPLMLHNSVGLIDYGYRGEITIAVVNAFSQADYTLHKGDSIAQLAMPDLKPFTVQIVDKLDDSERGNGAFGSTGV